MNATVAELIQRLQSPVAATARVIKWGSPVPSFGDPIVSRVATLGLNPSNKEFVDDEGRRLAGASQRFHSLKSLGLRGWDDARDMHVRDIIASCKKYFDNNPYDSWFKQLDHLISGTGSSYYNERNRACHLDLIPFATFCKWSLLSKAQREGLLRLSGDILAKLIRDSDIRVLVLNGKTVVDHFRKMSGIEFTAKAMPSWALRRGKDASVQGIAYSGTANAMSGISFTRSVLILGYNHNIQSSFGVTNAVRSEIKRWISESTKEGVA